MAFMTCSCGYKEKKIITDYVEHITENDFTIIKIEKLKTFNTYNSFMEEVKEIDNWCEKTQKEWGEFYSKYFPLDTETSNKVLERIQKAIDVQSKCSIVKYDIPKSNYKPIQKYRCEYKRNFTKNIIYVYVIQSWFDEYKVFLGKHYFNVNMDI